MLKNKKEKLEFSKEYLDELNLDDLEKGIMYIYIQNHIFSDLPLEDEELSEILGKSRPTINKNIKKLIQKKYIKEISRKPMIHVIDNKLKEILD